MKNTITAERNMMRQNDEYKPLARIESLLLELVHETCKSANRKNRVVDIDSPWLSLAKAARYCDYSPEHFRDLVEEFEIPRHGPHKNKFNRFELDRWMEEPKCFKQPLKPRNRRRTPGSFKIHDLVHEESVIANGPDDTNFDHSEWVHIATVVEDN